MRRPLRFIPAIATFALVLSLAGAAFAAPATWERIDVTRHSGENGGVTLVSGELPASAPLPAQAELAVPAGSELQWIGEILGGAVTEDPELKYTKTTANGLDVYRFTLAKSRTAQIEVPVADTQAFDGTTYSSSLAWTASQNVPEVRLNLRVPQAAKIATLQAGAALSPGDSAYAFYTKTFQNVKAGDVLDLAVAYSLPAAGATTAVGAAGAAAPSSRWVVPIVLVLLVAAAFAGLVVGVRRKMAGSADVESDDLDEREAPQQKSRAARASDTDAKREFDDESSSAGVSRSGRAPLSGKARRNLVTFGIIGALTVVAVVVGVQTTRPQGSGDTITQVFAAGEACANSSFPLAVADGADSRKTAEALFAAIKPIPGLIKATYNVKTKSIDIAYCESSSSENVLRDALIPTGLVAAGGAVVPAAQ